MASSAVGGLESAAEPGGVERVTFPCFDGFRAIAAISVLVTHVAYLSGFNSRSRLGALTARMDVGVAVFFMISGFLLYRPFVAARLANAPRPSLGAYFWRRALRIFPAYWLALTVTIFVLHLPKHVPPARDLFLYYGLFHLYSVRNVVGPILSSYTLVTELAFYFFLPVYAFFLRRVRGSPERQVRTELLAVGWLFVGGVVYRAAITAHAFPVTRAGQLQNVLPGWIDVFAVGMGLAVLSAWFAHRKEGEVIWTRLRIFPAASWALSGTAFVAISVWIGRPSHGSNFFTFWEDMGIHYLYLVTGMFFLLPGIFGPQRAGAIRGLLRNRAVQWLGLISYGLYLWNESWLEKFVQWTGRSNPVFPAPSPFWRMFLAVFALSIAVSALSYYLLERPVLSLKSRIPRRRSLPAAAD